jgi:hypothetical protein
MLLQTVCGGLRWHQVRTAIEGAPQNPTRTVLFYYASIFFNVCLPSTMGGDVARAWLAKRSGVTTRHVIWGQKQLPDPIYR